jgi:hypothetical protein
MSYILDSLKKSEKERQSATSTAAMTISSPAFLENDKPQNVNPFIWVALAVITLVMLAYWLFFFNQSEQLDISIARDINERNNLAIGNQTIAQPQKNRVVASLIPQEPSKAKQEAILLYEKALEEKTKPQVDLLYRTVNNDKVSTEDSSVEELNNLANISSSETVEDIIESAKVPIKEEAVEKKPEVFIPTIYQLDPVFKRNIPTLDYGAHIYATDNESGFIILNGARRRVGDQLDNGIFIEKIAEEEAVLSYNGTVFSLPAMKSWTGK